MADAVPDGEDQGEPSDVSSTDSEVSLGRAKGVQIVQPGGTGTQYNFQLPPRSPPSWPVRVGQVPGLASAYQRRAGLRARIEAAHQQRGEVVLTQVLSGGGGVGKSQLAASYASESIRAGRDLVVWVDAGTAEALIAAYAQAATQVQAPGATGQAADVETDANAFLSWVAATDRSWLVVLDDIRDPNQISGWWPASHTGTGWVLATTRNRDANLTGAGRKLVLVEEYEVAEARTYLNERLAAVDMTHLLDEGVGDLVQVLGRLPLALSHAAAYMMNQHINSSAYLELYTAGVKKLHELMPGDPDGHGHGPDGHNRRITTTMLLALDAADASDPVGLARPAMDLAAVLDVSGHPETFWSADGTTLYLTNYRTQDIAAPTQAIPGFWSRLWSRIRTSRKPPVTIDEARAAVLVLHRYNLLAMDEQPGPRSVRVHALTARAARDTASEGHLSGSIRAAAWGVYGLWDDADPLDRDLAAALRANTEALIVHRGDTLWHPYAHPILLEAGTSLLNSGLPAAAVTYWERTTADALRIQGPDHRDSLYVQSGLANAYRLAGRTEEAITLDEAVLGASVRIRGQDHPDTIGAQNNLATSYSQAGRTDDAIALLEHVVAQTLALWGPGRRATLIAQSNLAAAYRMTGRTAEAIALGEAVVAARVRADGPDHVATLGAQNNLAAAYVQGGRANEAIVLASHVAAETLRIQGPEHPNNVLVQSTLAAAYQQVGRIDEAIDLLERTASHSTRILGPNHPETAAVIASLREMSAAKIGAPPSDDVISSTD